MSGWLLIGDGWTDTRLTRDGEFRTWDGQPVPAGRPVVEHPAVTEPAEFASGPWYECELPVTPELTEWVEVVPA